MENLSKLMQLLVVYGKLSAQVLHMTWEFKSVCCAGPSPDEKAATNRTVGKPSDALAEVDNRACCSKNGLRY